MTHQQRCKFCGVMLTVESDPDCPQEWAESLLKLLACNRCADYRAKMTKIGVEIRRVCTNYIQLVNSKKGDEETKSKTRKLLEGMTWKVAEATCKFYGTPFIYDQEFVDQIMEHPDKSTIILKAYAKTIREEARRQKYDATKTVLHGSGAAVGPEAAGSLSAYNKGKLAAAKDDTFEPARSPGQDQSRRLSEELI